MARKTKADALVTRDSILLAGLKVFSRDGYGATNLEAIAAQACVSRGAVYWHFSGKTSLLHAVCTEFVLPLACFCNSRSLNASLASLRAAIIFSLSDEVCRNLLYLLIHKNEGNEPVLQHVLDLRSRFDTEVQQLVGLAGGKAGCERSQFVCQWMRQSVYGLLAQELLIPSSPHARCASISVIFATFALLMQDRNFPPAVEGEVGAEAQGDC